MRIFIDLDDTLCDYSGAHAAALARCPHIAYPQSQVDFYRALAPLPGSLEGVARLRGDGRHEVWILSAPSICNPLSYMEKRLWVSDHLGNWGAERLILCPDKSLCIGDYLVDDRTEGRGQERFGGELVPFGGVDFPNWAAVTAYLLQR